MDLYQHVIISNSWTLYLSVSIPFCIFMYWIILHILFYLYLSLYLNVYISAWIFTGMYRLSHLITNDSLSLYLHIFISNNIETPYSYRSVGRISFDLRLVGCPMLWWSLFNRGFASFLAPSWANFRPFRTVAIKGNADTSVNPFYQRDCLPSGQTSQEAPFLTRSSQILTGKSSDRTLRSRPAWLEEGSCRLPGSLSSRVPSLLRLAAGLETAAQTSVNKGFEGRWEWQQVTDKKAVRKQIGSR